MDIDCLPFEQTGYFSDLICDYIKEEKNLRSFYNRFPKLGDFEAQIAEKSANFPEATRSVLYDSLQQQYRGVTMSKLTRANLIQLKEPITFTVVTGHQLNLFTGPLYFLYKIISTVNLTLALKKKYPKFNFVPVYWMATEDHDFEEINYFNFRNKKIQWAKNASGGVGRLDTKDLDEVFETFSSELGSGKNAEALKKLFKDSYVNNDTLAEATRFLANELFGAYGLVIVNGDQKELKRLLAPLAKKDIFEHTTFEQVTKTIKEIKELPTNYGIQVNPREINYFYLKEGMRERILTKDNKFQINDTGISFTKDEMSVELEQYPERFSPNVITRPLYQELILPNLCYVGGGGELAYWLELKRSFEVSKVTFPILLTRNSALVVSKKQLGKLNRMNLSIADLFLEQSSFINKKIREISNIEIDFSIQKKHLSDQFRQMYEIAEQTDKSFYGAVKAQEAKQLKGLEKLEKRLLKAQKRKLKNHVQRMTEIQNELFPGQSLQERNLNFSEFYLEYGEELIPLLMKDLDPLRLDFSILYH